jgi:hypothetical protein
MLASITSKESRDDGSIIQFNIDHSNYDNNSRRVLTRAKMLDNSTVLTDWGFSEGDRIISITNIVMDETSYLILESMKEDNSNNFYFSYGTDIWNAVLEQTRAVFIGKLNSINKYSVEMTIAVISRASYE